MGSGSVSTDSLINSSDLAQGKWKLTGFYILREVIGQWGTVVVAVGVEAE